MSSEKPRLLYVSTLDHIVRVMLPHLDGARAAGYTVEVACRFTRFADEIAVHADVLHDLPMRRFPLHPANLIALAKLTYRIQYGDYTIVHCHNPTGGIVGRWAATLARCHISHLPLRVYTAHGFHFHRHGNPFTNFLYRMIETFAGNFLSDAVLTINEEDYSAARRTVVPVKKLFLTPGVGVSAHDIFNPDLVTDTEVADLRRELGAYDNTLFLTVVGELIPRKRQKDAITAFTEIARRHPNARLLIVGDGAETAHLQSLANILNIENTVRFMGFRRDIRTILKASTLFVFPSQQEGLPCSVQEALSMGIPTVATDVRGNRDLVDDENGRLVPLGRPDLLAATVCELLALPVETRKAMGDAGRAKMVRLYDRPASVAACLAIYETLLHKNSLKSR